MSVNTTLAGLSQTPASNGPDGTADAPSTLDDAIRNALSFIALLRDGKASAVEVDVASAGTCDIGAANSRMVRITGTTTITSFGTNYTGPRFVRFAGALTLTHNASTLILPGAANITTVAGDSAVAIPIGSTPSGWQVLFYTRADGSTLIAPPRSYLAGLTLSTAGSSATFAVAAGSAVDSTNVATLILAASISKTTATWAVGSGNGGIDTGAVANSTWYHVYLIRRIDTGVVDAIFSLSASAPALPTNYTQYRRIGAMKTNGSAQWTSFIQDGDYFRWLASVADVGTVNPGSSAVTSTLTVPTGVNVQANINVRVVDTVAGGFLMLVSDLAATDETPAASSSPFGSTTSSPSASVPAIANLTVRTNTSAQVRYRLNNSTANTTASITTLGWTDTRGRFA